MSANIRGTRRQQTPPLYIAVVFFFSPKITLLSSAAGRETPRP